MTKTDDDARRKEPISKQFNNAAETSLYEKYKSFKVVEKAKAIIDIFKSKRDEALKDLTDVIKKNQIGPARDNETRDISRGRNAKRLNNIKEAQSLYQRRSDRLVRVAKYLTKRLERQERGQDRPKSTLSKMMTALARRTRVGDRSERSGQGERKSAQRSVLGDRTGVVRQQGREADTAATFNRAAQTLPKTAEQRQSALERAEAAYVFTPAEIEAEAEAKARHASEREINERDGDERGYERER